MRLVAAVLLLAFGLAGCAEINKPITPDDEWRERGTRNHSCRSTDPQTAST